RSISTAIEGLTSTSNVPIDANEISPLFNVWNGIGAKQEYVVVPSGNCTFTAHTFKVPEVVLPPTTPLITAAKSIRTCCGRLVPVTPTWENSRATATPEHGLAAESGTQSTEMSPTLMSEPGREGSSEKHMPGPPRLVPPPEIPSTSVF